MGEVRRNWMLAGRDGFELLKQQMARCSRAQTSSQESLLTHVRVMGAFRPRHHANNPE
jgi:hypothetical protein